jgi:hypothetical protein
MQPSSPYNFKPDCKRLFWFDDIGYLGWLFVRCLVVFLVLFCGVVYVGASFIILVNLKLTLYVRQMTKPVTLSGKQDEL